jgi:hypothetical protein
LPTCQKVPYDRSFFRFASVFIIGVYNFINKDVLIKSLPGRRHHHIIASGPRETDPTRHVPSSNIPSGSCWPRNSGCKPHWVPRIIQIKTIFITGEKISELLWWRFLQEPEQLHWNFDAFLFVRLCQGMLDAADEWNDRLKRCIDIEGEYLWND